MKLCGQKKLATADPSTSLSTEQLTARAAVSIAKDSCSMTEWSAAFTTNPKYCQEVALLLLLTVLSDMLNRHINSWFLDLLGGEHLSRIPFSKKSSANNSPACSASAPKRKRRKNSTLAEDDSDYDSDGPESVPARAEYKYLAPGNNLRVITERDINIELQSTLRKVKRDLEAAQKDSQLSSKDAFRAVIQQRQMQRELDALRKDNAVLRGELQVLRGANDEAAAGATTEDPSISKNQSPETREAGVQTDLSIPSEEIGDLMDYVFAAHERANNAEAQAWAAESKHAMAEEEIVGLKQELAGADTTPPAVGCSAIEGGENEDQDPAAVIKALKARLSAKNARITQLEDDNTAKVLSNSDTRILYQGANRNLQVEVNRLKEKCGEKVYR